MREWFRRAPDRNVGIVTGALSGLVVLDIDPRHGGDESLRKLEREHGSLPETLESITGGDGGCIVVPPSVHPSGKRYHWVKGRSPGQANLSRLPDWLH